MSALLVSAPVLLAFGALSAFRSVGKILVSYLHHQASLRSLERVIASSSEHAHLINDLVAAESGAAIPTNR